MKTLLVTGGAGFIGSNYIKYILEREADYSVINLDKLTYAGNLENLNEVEKHPNYRFVKGDIANTELLNYLFEKYKIKYVVNFAAESHVDRSILSYEDFIRTNVHGTGVLLNVSKEFGVERFLQVSTDEVYGSLGSIGYFKESTPLSPNSPYSASKASADLLALAFNHTFGLPVVITRCSNNYGPYQFPEKLIPLMIIKALNNEKLPVYGDGLNVRDWIYVLDHNIAIHKVLERGNVGEVYNIGAEKEMKNIEIVKLILDILKKPHDLIEFVKDRPGHDKRYAIDASKIKNELSWEPNFNFENAIADTIDWYIKNQNWWKRILNKDYLTYYFNQYGTGFNK